MKKFQKYIIITKQNNEFINRNNNIYVMEKKYRILLYIIILFRLFFLTKNQFVNIRKFNFINEITIIVNGKGTQKILNNVNQVPSQILVNNNISNYLYIDNYIYNLTEEENIITMIWNESLTSCNKMFYKLSNIVYINLSNFKTSSITNMEYMFYGCNSLISLDLSNFNTTLVTTMRLMFYGCNSLISLDLSNFNTTLVTNMEYMFSYCDSLISLDLIILIKH